MSHSGGGCQPNSHEIHPADLQRVSERGHQLPQVARMHEYRNCTRKKCPQSQRPSTQTRHLGKRSLLCLARLRVRQGVGVELYSDTHGVPCIGVVRRCVLHAKESQCRQGGGRSWRPEKKRGGRASRHRTMAFLAVVLATLIAVLVGSPDFSGTPVSIRQHGCE